ncbi:MAG: hypothetical protein JXQ96_00910 [Cyclobacteriaceae bacterium]
MKLKIRFVRLVLILPFISSFIVKSQTSEESIYTERFDDPQAVYLNNENFNVAADGTGDDAPAIQSAIDLVREKSGGGIVFIPEGTYRLGKTVYVWRGIRLIGYGKERPIFKLGENTPGYQEGDHQYMVHFCQNPPGTPGPLQPNTWVTEDFQDGTYTTFYSGLQNINFEIGDGNPAAIAIRYHVAQVCVLDHINFNIGQGRGGIQAAGNIIENCTFQGGEFGIKTEKSAPSWQITVLDCSFEGQRESSIITSDAKMLVIRGRFKNTPIGIFLPGPDQIYVQDTWFEDIGNTAFQINHYVHEDLQVNFDNLKFSNVPYSVKFKAKIHQAIRRAGRVEYEAPAPVYTIKEFSQGIHLENPQGNALLRHFGVEIDESPIETLGEFPKKEIADLPEAGTWVNIADLSAKGDGETDCTKVFERAIAKYDAIYVPMGNYVISRSLTLRERTTLIGLHPYKTRLVLSNGTEGFQDVDDPRPLLIAPEGGSNGITGIGIDLGINPGAIGLKWMAGSESFVNDGLFRTSSKCERGEGSTHSIWVTNGGGGAFKNIWIVDNNTDVPFYINKTKTPGKIYEISVEHHKYHEVVLENVENWSFYGLQLEEDTGSEKVLAVEISNCRNILFANLRSHRTSGIWDPYYAGVLLRNSNNISIKGNHFSGFVFPYDHTLFDESTGLAIPNLKFTKLHIK